MKEVTDPALLQALEAREVTDPALLAQLEGKTFKGKANASFLDKLREVVAFDPALQGLLRGGRDVLDTGAELLATPFGQGAQVKQNNDAEKAKFAQQFGDSGLASGFRVAGNVGATLPVGGAIAAPLRGAAPALSEAIATSGMRAGSLSGVKGMAARTAGGAVTGGASAGLVDPESAETGAAIGAALPGAIKAAGTLGNAAGRALSGPAPSPQTMAAFRAARQSGYVVPPTQIAPNVFNRVMEGTAGKLTTAQNASARNQAVTNAKAAASLGLPKDTALTPDLLTNIRQQAGQAYDAIGQTGTVTPGASYNAALDRIAAPHVQAAQGFPNAAPSPVLGLVDSLRAQAFDAGSAVAKIKELRTAADDAFRTGNTDVGRASKAAAKALEDALENHLQQIGQPDLLKAFRDARTQIAKTYTVEKALNPTTGTVDAKKIAGELKKGKPLSGDLREIAEFSAAFPKASQATEAMGSLPQLSPLDFALGGGVGVAAQNPLAFGLPLVRPMARSAALSNPLQNRLAPNPLPPGDNNLLRLLYQSAPVLGANR